MTEQLHFLLLSIWTEKEKLYSNALLQKIALCAGVCVCVCVCVCNFLGSFSRKRVYFQLGMHLCLAHGHAGDKLCLDYSR